MATLLAGKNPLHIPENPLHIPEIRSRISRLVSVKDAISCVRVSKDWYKDFIYHIWYAVDFKVHNTFQRLSADIIAKHGHHIRIVENLKTQRQLNALVHSSIKNVRVLHLTCAKSARFRILCMDLISNNNRSLKDLTFRMDENVKTGDLSARMISIDAFISHSSVSLLSLIHLRGVCFSRNSFASLLRGCPLLTSVYLQDDVTMLSGSSIDSFQHMGVITLMASIKNVFKPDPGSEVLPLGLTLLVHFPNLTCWLCHSLETTLIVSSERIKEEARICCPKLSYFYTFRIPSLVLYDLVANAFNNLKTVAFEYEKLSMDIIVALLFHQTTLQGVSAIRCGNQSETEQDDFLSEEDPFRESGRALQLLPRSCSNLTALAVELHKMDMDFVEEKEWACRGLQQLRVRIRSLDTEEKVNRAHQLWVEGIMKKNKNVEEEEQEKRTGQEEGNNELTESPANGIKETSIEERVARHLLKFDQLKSVWLGTRTLYAASKKR
ncbi:hypothetical protein EDD21DRAFT_390677 [Dissophora ornata]|nr:hypothetical protein EDD21DRAFT_390677 [Dissophora ornata]